MGRPSIFKTGAMSAADRQRRHRRGKMDERATWRLLKAIRDLARLGYPYSEDADIDPRLLLALGEIMGIAVKALKEYEEGEGADDRQDSSGEEGI